MAKAALKLIGFKKLKDILDPAKIEKRMKKHVGKATLKNGLIAEGAIKSAIDKGKIKGAMGKRAPNADLTVALKGSDRPLVDSGQLKKSITSEVKSWDLALIGINRNRTVVDSKGKKRSVMRIAEALHDGATIKVTNKMRAYFYWLAYSDDSPFQGIVKPLKKSTKVIRIPPRPFLAAALTNRLLKRYNRQWDKAIIKVLQGKN